MSSFGFSLNESSLCVYTESRCPSLVCQLYHCSIDMRENAQEYNLRPCPLLCSDGGHFLETRPFSGDIWKLAPQYTGKSEGESETERRRYVGHCEWFVIHVVEEPDHNQTVALSRSMQRTKTNIILKWNKWMNDGYDLVSSMKIDRYTQRTP